MTGSKELVKHQLDSGGVVADDTVLAPSACRLQHPPVAHFGDASRELLAAQKGCAVFDVTDRTLIELRGKDAAAFLHKFCTNDVERLTAGEGCEAFLTNVKGRILAHVFVFVTDTSVLLDSPATDEETLLSHFDRYLFSEDVQLLGHSKTDGDLYLSGDTASTQLTALGLPVESLALMQHTTGSLKGMQIQARRVDLWERPGFLLTAARQHHVELWNTLVAAGVQPAGSQAFHACRIQAGFPIYGIDLSEENLAQEAARTAQAISFTKGCYLGQEPIARIDSIGHINRCVTQVRIEQGTCLACATPLLMASDAESSNTAAGGPGIGAVTSSVVVPGTEHVIALAMLRASHNAPGTPLAATCEQTQVAATVV